MIYTSRKRSFRRFIKTHNLKYYFAFLAMVLAIVAAVIVMTRNNRQNRPPEGDEPDKTATTGNTSETETDIPPDSVRGVYRLCLNLGTGRMAAYGWDSDQEAFSEQAERYMLFAVKKIREGEYASPHSAASKSAWAASEKENRFYRYVTAFGDQIVFHSADYDTMNDRNSLIVDSYNAIEGEGAFAADLSDGVTLTVADAKWIYENCSFESEIVVYTDKNEERHKTANQIIPIPEGITWEPTDASNGTPWCQTELSDLSTLPELEVRVGSPRTFLFNPIKAVDIDESDVTEYVYLTGDFDLRKAGVYALTYHIIDVFGNHLQQALKLTVSEPETTPEATSGSETNPQQTEPTKEPDSKEPDSSGAETTAPEESEPPTAESAETTKEDESESGAGTSSGEESAPAHNEETTTEEPPASE